MLNIAICDDDSIFIERFEKLITNELSEFPHMEYELHIIADDGEDCIELAANQQIDVLFLDIQLPSISGKEIARRIRMRNKTMLLIFLTSLETEMLETYQYEVFDYIPKSLLETRISLTVRRIVEKYKDREQSKEQFLVYLDDNAIYGKQVDTIYMNVNEILYFETVNKKIYIHHSKGKQLLARIRYEEIKKQYCKYGFIDIHRTCMVNPKYIYLVREQEVELDNGICLPLSRRKRSNVTAILAQLMLREGE